MPIVPDSHADAPRMAATRAVESCVEIQLFYHLVARTDDQTVEPRWRLGQTFAPALSRGKRELGRSPNRFGMDEYPVERRKVTRLRVANGQNSVGHRLMIEDGRVTRVTVNCLCRWRARMLHSDKLLWLGLVTT